jgi:hypothetical protein
MNVPGLRRRSRRAPRGANGGAASRLARKPAMNQSRFSFPPGVAFQPLGDDQDGVMMSLSSGYLYRCNRTACFVLAAISEGKSVDEATNELSQIFGVESSRVREDVDALITNLCERKLLRAAA